MKALAKWSASSAEQANQGKTDLLLRYFQSNPFDPWVALQGLHQNTQPGVYDYLCNRLHELGEEALEKYLLQLVYLAISKPGHPLEQTIVNLCQKSFRVAIKTQWLLVALCQDHPKSKALESFRDRAYKAALEGKWEVPIRNPKLDPLSPPPFSPVLSPGSSLMCSQLPSAPDLQSAQQRLYDLHSIENQLPPVRYVVTQPPGRMVMSPPGASLAGTQSSGRVDDRSSLGRRKSGALQIDLGCLLPAEQRIAPSSVAPAASADEDPSTPPSAPVANGFVTAAADGASRKPSARYMANSASCAVAAAAAAASGAVPIAAGDVAGPSQLACAQPLQPAATQAAPAALQSRVGAFGVATANAISAAASSLAERYQSIRRELGEGEGVTALLERSKQQGGGYVAAAEELSDDEFSNRPMSPLTRLRYDTFGATLDFVEALCDASASLASYSQEERHRALRLSLEHINREIEAANRRDVAIWFPMGRGGDRVLRLTAREAVVLNSREKAPFMLLVEVLEGQQECGDEEPLAVQSRGGDQGTLALSTIAGGGATASCGGGSGVGIPTPVVQFGRRETYGIALTGIGAQHQQHFMLSSPSPVAFGGVGAAAAASVATITVQGGSAGHHDAPDGHSQGGSTTSGRASLPSNGTATVDTASLMADTPGGLSPSMSLSSQFRSRAGSPVQVAGQASGPHWQQPQQHGPSLQVQQPLVSSPTPVHAASGAMADALEEQAAAAAARMAACASAAPALGGLGAVEQTGSGLRISGNGNPPTAPLQLQQQVAGGAVYIPTRSASNSNIAAAAVAATMAAACNGPVPDAYGRSSRGSDGVTGGGPAAGAHTPALPVPAGCLPPRPPPPLPTGCMSPINAAKEVPVQLASQAPSALLSASALLRRVLGDRVEDVAAAGSSSGANGNVACAAGASGGGGKAGKESTNGFNVVRSLCFSNSDSASSSIGHGPRDEPIASAAATAASAAVGSHLIPLPPVAAVPPLPGKPLGHRGLSAGGGSSDGAAPKPRALQQPAGGELSEAEMQELLASGCLSPPNAVKTDPDMAAKLSGLLASLRGEAPMVRVRIRVLPQPEQPPSVPAPLPSSSGFQEGERPAAADVPSGVQPPVQTQHPASSAAASTGSAPSQGSPAAPLSLLDRAIVHLTGASGDSSGAGAASASGASEASGSFSLASLALPSRMKAAIAALPTMASDDGSSATGTGGGGGSSLDSGLPDKSKALALLSKLGLCRRPTAEDDVDASVAASIGGAGGAALPAASGVGGEEPVACERKRYWSGSSALRGPRLVQVSFEVAQGVNLAIPSPYRKSRRTPSHEAIEMLAGKYKIQQMPPPYQCGPPLGPFPDSPRGSTYTLQERPGEEDEGGSPAEDVAEASFSQGTSAARPFLSRAASSALASVPGTDSPAGGLVEPLAGTKGAVSTTEGRLGLVAPTDSTFSLGRRTGPRAASAGSGGAVAAPSTAQQSVTASPPTPTLHQRASLERSGPAPPAEATQSSSGLAASLQSSLTRMLARASGQQSQSDGGSGPSKGPSPRGGSPARGVATSPQPSAAQGAPPAPAAAPATGGGGSRLARLMGGGSSGVVGGAPLEPQAAAPLQAAGQPQQAHPPRNSIASAGGVRPSPPQTAPGVKVTDGRQERESAEERRRREAVAVYGERWAAKVKRIQGESPHGRRAGWALRCVIVKSGDDCRQELLALQLIRIFGEIFRDAGLPLWVRHYEVLVTSNKTALIEMVPNTLSIHTIKSRSPSGTSLSDHFFAKFGRAGTSECTAAQRRFTESMAAYSLICYVLQIKDRHNGNILLDDDGRVVHIDFGFLLSNSPGGVNFEAAPFKLTRELLEVMDSNSEGRPSEMFDYFKVLMIQGFLALRKHADRILLLVRMMSKSGFPCFKAGDRAVKALEKRLQLTLTEVQCVAHVLQLIAESLDAWRTRQYDYYQRVLNGIL